jgi:hypothetical protein
VVLLAHTAKDAAALQAAVSMGMAMAMMQPAAQQAKDLLKGVQVTTQERTIRLSLTIPEEKLIEAVKEQMKQGAPNWMGGPRAPLGSRTHVTFTEHGGGEVVVQGGETPGRPAATAGDTQVIVLGK